jgi:hypothetical protein
MQFTLEKASIKAIVSAFKKDKLAKGVRKIERHGLHRFAGTLEARDDTLFVKSGRVSLSVKANVSVPGAFSIRDAVLRELLTTLGDERSLDVVAEPEGLRLNGSFIQLPADDFTFPLAPSH